MFKISMTKRKTGYFGIFAALLLILVFFQKPAYPKITDLRPSGPLKVRSQNPLYLQFLALPMESPQTLNRDQFETAIQTTFSNIFEFDQNGRTHINLDMELWRTALTFGYGLTDELDVKVELPFITSSSGFLDGFIQWYHNLFGLPNGGRELVADNQFAYTLSQDGTTLINYRQTAFGLSDIIVRFKYLLSDRGRLPFKLAIAPYVKLPTGQSSLGLGSGHADLGLSLLAEKRLKQFTLVTHLGGVLITDHDHLSALIRNGVLSFGQSLEFQILDGLSIVAQLTGNTTAFKSIDAQDLKEIVLDFSVGFAGTFPVTHVIFDEFFYQWGFSEDILSSGPSVDFSILFLAGLRY